MALSLVGLASWVLWQRSSTKVAVDAAPAMNAERAARVAKALGAVRERHNAVLKTAAPFDVSRDKALRAALDQPENVKASMKKGDAKWMPTVLALENLSFARDERLECDRALGQEIESNCSFRLHVAVERTGPNRGVVRRADGRPNANEAVCEAYAACRADGYLGKEMPLPAGGGDVYGIEQSLVTFPFRQELLDPGKVEADLQVMRQGLEENRATLDLNDPQNVYMIETLSNQIAYKEQWLSTLREHARR
jgi:hypothetical protein